MTVILCFAFQPFMQYSSAQITSYPPYENYGGDSDICTNADIVDDFTSDITSNYTRTTMVSYGGTNLITTIVLGTINSSNTITLENYGNFGKYTLSNSTLFSADSLKKITADGIYGVRNVTLGLTNIGNKTVTVVVPGDTNTTLIVVNTKSGATVDNVDDYDFATYKAIRGLNNMAILSHYGRYSQGGVENVYLVPIKLEPGESIMRQTWHLETMYDFDKTQHDPMGSITPTHHAGIAPGNYTMSAVSKFLAATDQGCTMVYLWSQPVDLTVGASSVPEFPFSIPILLISIFSVIMIYKIKIKITKN